MNRITSILQKNLYKKPLTPIMIKTTQTENLATELKDYLPTEIMRILPRINMETVFASIRKIPKFNLIALPASLNIINELADDRRVEKLYYDREMLLNQNQAGIYDTLTRLVFTTTSWTRKLIGLEKAKADGYTGQGTKIAILDTGGTKFHPQTRNLIKYTTIRGIYTDRNGHGQHVATIAGGTKAMDPILHVEVEGMAPAAQLISIKTLGFVIGIGRESNTLEGLNKTLELQPDIVNMSLGTNQLYKSDETDPLEEAITILSKSGILTVCAAGNAGPKPSTVTSPGDSPNTITVGAWDELQNAVAPFSSRGPGKQNTIKPDIVAPGVRIHSGITGILDVQSDFRKQHYGYLDGTSMACPHVSGLLSCAKQLFKEYGAILNNNIAMNIFETNGTPKNNNTGHGLIQWNWFETWAKK